MVFFRPIIAGVFLAESLVGVIKLGDFVGGVGGVVVLLVVVINSFATFFKASISALLAFPSALSATMVSLAVMSRALSHLALAWKSSYF